MPVNGMNLHFVGVKPQVERTAASQVIDKHFVCARDFEVQHGNKDAMLPNRQHVGLL
jgi:hypothetical protein